MFRSQSLAIIRLYFFLGVTGSKKWRLGIWCREIWYVNINTSEKHTSPSLYLEEGIIFNLKNVDIHLSD